MRMASLANSSLFPSPFNVKDPPIEPEISNTITAFKILSSLSYPSFEPFVNIVK